MGEAQRFADLVLDDEELQTPVGAMPLSEIVRAEFVRDVVSYGREPGTEETSAPAVVGGAAVGGALLGGVGAIAGGLLGSTVKEEVPGRRTVHTKSVSIVFETGDLAYSMDIAREQEVSADRFVRAVRRAMRHRH